MSERYKPYSKVPKKVKFEEPERDLFIEQQRLQTLSIENLPEKLRPWFDPNYRGQMVSPGSSISSNNSNNS